MHEGAVWMKTLVLLDMSTFVESENEEALVWKPMLILPDQMYGKDTVSEPRRSTYLNHPMQMERVKDNTVLDILWL